jgi:hypothetical protein
LDFEILLVSIRDRFGGQPFQVPVDVHVQGHTAIPPVPRVSQRGDASAQE